MSTIFSDDLSSAAFVQGDTLTQSVQLWSDVAQTIPYNLTGMTVRLQAKTKASKYSPAVLELSEALGTLTFVDAANGKFSIQLTSEQTEINAGTYFYDWQIQSIALDANGYPNFVFTFASGTLTVVAEVTTQ